ncbi:unnamed protein product [Camellia sinensis]
MMATNTLLFTVEIFLCNEYECDTNLLMSLSERETSAIICREYKHVGMATGRGRGSHSPSPIPDGEIFPVLGPDPRRGIYHRPRPRPRPLTGIRFPRSRKFPGSKKKQKTYYNRSTASSNNRSTQQHYTSTIDQQNHHTQ